MTNTTNMTNTNELKEMKAKIESLAVFAAIRENPAVAALHRLLHEMTVAAYSDFAGKLYPQGADLSSHIRRLLIEDDNFYVRAKASGKTIDDAIERTVDNELGILEEIAAIKSDDIRRAINESGFCPVLPEWTNSPVNLRDDFREKMANIHSRGYGMFATHTFFRVSEGKLIPVSHPEHSHLDKFFEYQRERDLIIRNTEALLSGGGSNMLLYGDMGTGKSSTIKAVAADFSHQGLRLVEIKKNQLFMIPDIMEQLADNPLKFILFIDDLSFSGNDDNFSALKATLEGSISGCGSNTLIYATSNRRHLVRESASDRIAGAGMDEDLHINDTLQETMSLSARFGLTITFSKPDKEEYLSIVKSLAEEYGLDVTDEEELFRRAEAFAIRKNGRSPRTARQFIELQKIGI